MSDVQLILKKVSTGEQTVLLDGLIAGRLPDLGLVLTEGHPSRRHAQFSISDNESRLEDLGSANGTYVNDQRLDGSTVLRSGDRIRFDIEEYEYLVIGDKTVQNHADKTMVRKPQPADVDIDGTNRKETPAWIDMEKQAEGGPKTEFIDAASMKKMIQVDDRPEKVGGDSIEHPVLLITDGQNSGLRVNLKTSNDRGEWTIGCDSDRDIVLQDQGVSGVHAKLVQDGRRWKLTDQMSANGTFVNGRRSNMSYLDNGDRIRIGPVECIFRTPDDSGRATRRTSGFKLSLSSKNTVLGIAAFIVTLAILYVVFRVL